MNRWYAVNTQPHQENKAQFNLVRQGYEAWLPLRRKTRRHARRIETIKAALFPNYLFVRLDLSCERWRPINGTFGVRQLVMRGDGPAPVADGFVEDLRATVTAKTAPPLRPMRYASATLCGFSAAPSATPSVRWSSCAPPNGLRFF